jgi:1,4-alpha-glucan branching enzyme
MSLSKNYPKSGKTCKVKFTIPASLATGAKEVRVLGDFNAWDTGAAANKMKKNDDGSFSKEVALDQGREYQFRYLIDGSRWVNDEAADKYLRSPTSPEDNSVVIV